MDRAKEYMKIKDSHTLPFNSTSKGELIDAKDETDLKISPHQRIENPYKTPPNNLTTKDNQD